MDLLKDNTKTLYRKFLFPSLGSAMVMSVYTMTDAIVIGKGVGADALAALSLTTPLLAVLMSTGILFGVGGSVHSNIQKGLKNEKKANRFFTLSFLGITAITLLLWGLYGFFMKELLLFMGASDVLYPYAMDYMRYIIMFLPVAVYSNFFAIFVRSDGAPNRAMTGVILGGIVNIFLDIYMVMFVKSGIGGAALASCIGMCLQILVSGSYFFSKRCTLHLIRPHRIIRSLLLILSSGLSAFINEFANGLIVFLFNIQILKYCGNNALAIYGVISNCVILFNSLFTGVGQAIAPLVSMNFGAKKQERVLYFRKISFQTVCLMGAIFSIAGIAFPHVVCGIFLKETAKLAAISDYALRMYFVAFFPMGINVLITYYLQSILRSKTSFGISMFRNIVFSGLAILLLPNVLPSVILWMIMPITELIAMIFCLIQLPKKPLVNPE